MRQKEVGRRLRPSQHDRTSYCGYPPLLLLSRPAHTSLSLSLAPAPTLTVTQAKRLYTEVVVGDEICAGRTVVDVYGMLAKGPKKEQAQAQHVYVTAELDVDAFWDMMISALELANAKSPCR